MDPETTQTDQFVEQLSGVAFGQAPALFTPLWAIVAVLVAIVASVIIGKLARLPGLRRVRRWLVLARVLLWAVVIFEVIFTLSWAITDYWLLLGVLLVGVLAIAGLDWLRNVAAGLALAFERQLEVGDLVGFRDIEGELVAFGARAVTLRTDDGTTHQVPNASITHESITNLQAEGDAACEISIEVPDHISAEGASEFARQASFLTPLASPHHRPQVFLDVDKGRNQVRMRIRGFAFDPAHRDHYRSDVIARLHQMLRNERPPTA